MEAETKSKLNLPLAWSCLAICVLGGLSPQCAAEDTGTSSARTVYVSDAEAQIRSGPSEDYYPTSYASLNTRLNVYHETKDGWLGIRPPEGSFSWVPAKDGYLLPGGKTVEITSDKSVSWIGTELGAAKHFRWQVELNPGEQLRVIGEATNTAADGSRSLWYKIAPPSGEFRWIHRRQVAREPVKEPEPGQPESAMVVRQITPTAAPEVDPDSATDVELASHSENGNPVRESSEVVTAQYQAPAPALPLELGPSSEYGPLDSIHMSGPPQENVHPDSIVYDHAPAEVVYERSTPYVTPGTSSARPSFAGWHAFDLTDDGFRFTLLERAMRKNRVQSDPLATDPFSLVMPAKVPPEQVIRPAADPYADRPFARRERPWRDPRTLGEMRRREQPSPDAYAGRGASDYYADNDQPGASGNNVAARQRGDMLTSIRQSVNNISSSVSRLRGGGSNSEDSFQSGGEFEFDGSEFDVRNEDLQQFDNGGSSGYAAASSNSNLNFSPVEGDPNTPQKVDWYGIKDRPSNRESISSNSGGQPSGRTAFNSSPDAGFNPQSRGASNNFVTKELNNLQVTLSEMVSRPPSLWDLEPLQRRTQYLIENGTNPVERGQARLLMERIEEFKQHAQKSALIPGGNFRAGYQAPPVNPTPAVTTASYQASPSPTNGSANGRQANLNQFDATGWLRPVHGRLLGDRYYALTDESGAVVAYVSTLPGMNLDSYLNQAVGIKGLKGYLPQLQAGHIQADHVVRL